MWALSVQKENDFIFWMIVSARPGATRLTSCPSSIKTLLRWLLGVLLIKRLTLRKKSRSPRTRKVTSSRALHVGLKTERFS